MYADVLSFLWSSGFIPTNTIDLIVRCSTSGDFRAAMEGLTIVEQCDTIENEQALIILNNQQHFLFWDKIKHISFQQKGMIILMKTKRQIYIGESDYEDFPNWRKSIKNQAISQGVYIQS